MRSIFPKLILLAIALLLLGGCADLKNLKFLEKEEKYTNWTAEKFFQEAKAAMKIGNYQKALTLLEKLEARYPFGKYAAQAQLETAYAYYKYQEPESAIAAADRFIKIHPRHPQVDYAYYLKGLVNYNRGIGFLERFLPTDSSQRDPGATLDSFRNFEELVKKFPDSKYAEDSRQRMTALRNNLAMYEIHVARYYMKRKAYIAAAQRGTYVVENYQRTPAMPLALDIMYRAYTQLGLTELAADAKRVYDINYANGVPYPEDMVVAEPTLIEKVWDFLKLDE